MSRPRFKPIVYDLEKNNNFVTKVSTNTTDRIPNIVYLRAKTRITPNVEKKTHEVDVLSVVAKFEEYATKLLSNNPNYDKNYIFSVDVAEKSVRYNKTSHLRYDIFLKPKNMLTLCEHKDILKEISDLLDNKLITLLAKHNLRTK